MYTSPHSTATRQRGTPPARRNAVQKVCRKGRTRVLVRVIATECAHPYDVLVMLNFL